MFILRAKKQKVEGKRAREGKISARLTRAFSSRSRIISRETQRSSERADRERKEAQHLGIRSGSGWSDDLVWPREGEGKQRRMLKDRCSARVWSLFLVERSSLPRKCEPVDGTRANDGRRVTTWHCLEDRHVTRDALSRHPGKRGCHLLRRNGKEKENVWEKTWALFSPKWNSLETSRK